MGDPTDEDAQAQDAARRVEAGTDDIVVAVDLLKEEGPAAPAAAPSIAAQIGRMSVIQKVKLAMMGGKEARILLSRDNNKLVRRFVLSNPRLTDSEAAAIANSRSTDEEQLRVIAGKREWMKNYAVRLAVVKNPKTPLPLAIEIVPTLQERDLARMAKSRDAPEGVVHHVKRVLLQRRERQGH